MLHTPKKWMASTSLFKSGSKDLHRHIHVHALQLQSDGPQIRAD